MVETHRHHPALKHHFDSMSQQHDSSTLGMWVFLATEVLFFGPLFFTYALYRHLFEKGFVLASHHQNVALGATNTVVLILSSLTVVMGVYFAQTNRKRGLVISLIVTLLLGCAFLGIKAIEYHQHFEEGLFPGSHFALPGTIGKQAEMFFILYFVMTGLHALHMIIGIGIFGYVLRRALRGDFSSEYYAPVEVTGLYWHFVDLVWIYLFPLLYLIGRHVT
jgi:Heme/copper-type cytochrome/quinol oxidase, subunit 3